MQPTPPVLQHSKCVFYLHSGDLEGLIVPLFWDGNRMGVWGQQKRPQWITTVSYQVAMIWGWEKMGNLVTQIPTRKCMFVAIWTHSYLMTLTCYIATKVTYVCCTKLLIDNYGVIKHISLLWCNQLLLVGLTLIHMQNWFVKNTYSFHIWAWKNMADNLQMTLKWIFFKDSMTYTTSIFSIKAQF